ncbi:threonine--tRNA ligase [Cellulomonas carbonis]|uniref:threonine--tRNA ligase n=1 Tax=Cellulomonas carbonis TaxID=1386092 RepID=UPI00166837A9|nr:threonine--tRNA ligase [Cellulomonas carbonis]GGC17799.1 threonine--tRNA ligase [Cellulomonas carbonis]
MQAADYLAGVEGAVAARYRGRLIDLSAEVPDNDTLEPVTADSEDGLRIIRHSCAHVLAQAVQSYFPDARLGIGPPIRDGFYYDFGLDGSFSTADLTRLEKRMRGIIAADQRFVRRVVTAAEAAYELAAEPFKMDLISLKDVAGEDAAVEVGDGELTIYDNVDRGGRTVWRDLCRGPHVPSTRFIPAFKLTRVAAAYWRGSEKNPQLQRIYGTAWESQEALDRHQDLIAEAERRDHRRLGRELELFHLDATAPGMPYWLPNGMRLLNNLLAFWREEHEARGYQEISTPLINNKLLWETSGHWEHYREDMFVVPGGDDATYAVKPMNCPNAMVVFNLKTRSYRDLPLRFSDCDPLHRNERSGTLHGLMRVQKFQQDDAHIFLRADQISEEYERIFDIADRFYSIFGLTYKLRLGTRPEGFLGDIGTWDQAEATLRAILDRRTDGDYLVEEGGGAFYGPKIDILMEDALGRQWQTGTIQLDFQLPRRFECAVTNERGERETPVVVHRVIYGSLERFIGIYIEHTAGAFPLWMAPVQVVIIPVMADYLEYAEETAAGLRRAGVAVEVDGRDETLGNRVRVAQAQKVPLTVVLGLREREDGTAAVRLRGQRSTVTVDRELFVDAVAKAVRSRSELILPVGEG